MLERTLGILGCKYTGDVLMDAPRMITKEMIVRLGITTVLAEENDPHQQYVPHASDLSDELPYDPLEVPKKMGILYSVSSLHSNSLSQSLSLPQLWVEEKKEEDQRQIISSQDYATSVDNVIARIMGEKEKFEQKIIKKKNQERQYYQQKYTDVT
eukprot:CAMPEP_0182417626 /NCGR_PEP_ID=MMETSP1167-20130531/2080_1 /TAXON_ID=2988 /ORGANISM="Mallomonas Sp, Strain CCMP3275" /LENGTH=154 /DNA_ID=CAMNT_0024591317 /DNA_START=233 /DNA_END=697 /DNA_ORIENTATION=-